MNLDPARQSVAAGRVAALRGEAAALRQAAAALDARAAAIEHHWQISPAIALDKTGASP